MQRNDTAVSSAIPVGNTVSEQQLPSDESVSESFDVPSAPNKINKYSFIWVSDTQKYSKYYPEIHETIIDWTIENIDNLNIKALFHTGDIIENYTSVEQWEAASTLYKKLNNRLDYIVLAGNHDVNFSEVDYSYYFKYFGNGERVVPNGDGGIYDNGKAQYLLFSTESCDYLFLAFCWNTSTGMIKWANDLLKQHSGRTVIFMTHNYLNIDGELSTNGTRLFEQLVTTSPNIKMVLCGHYHSAASRITELDDDGDGKFDRTVYQYLADYQGEENGGGGYIRIISIDEAEKILVMTTYSPYLDDYDFYEYEQENFVIDISDWLSKQK